MSVSKKRMKRFSLFVAVLIPFILIITLTGIQKYRTFPNTHFYDFEDDDIGEFPEGFARHYRSVAVQVVQWNLPDGHYGKVAEIGYFTAIKENGIELNTVFNKATKGTIEFDIYIKFILNRVYIDLCQEDAIYDYKDDVAIRGWDTETGLGFWVVDKYGMLEEISEFNFKNWYHFKIVFDVKTGYDLTITKQIDSRIIFSGHIDFFHIPEYFTQLYFGTYRLNSVFYVDNIDIVLTELY